jgi:ABC-type nitrate/sulfonate/bicarbonate transport system substrate-binding protein
VALTSKPRGWLAVCSATLLLLAACSTPSAAPTPAAPAASTSAAPAGASPKPAGAAASAVPSAVASAVPAGAAAPAAAPAAPAQPLTKVVAAYAAPIPNVLPEWIAKEAGIFEKNGLDVEFQIIQTANLAAALLSGQVHITSGGSPEAVAAATSGADLVFLGVEVNIFPWKFYARPEIKQIEDLKGKKIGITTAGAPYDVGLRMVLPTKGLKPDTDVTLVPAGSIPNVTAALISGAIDGAALVVGPDSDKAIQQGMHELFDFADLNVAYPTSALVARRSWVNQNRATAQKYVDSIVEAIAREKKDKPYTISIMRKNLGITDEQALSEIYDYFTRRAVPSQPVPRPEIFTDMVASLGQSSERIRNLDINTMLEPSFAQSAIERGLDK